MKNIAKYISLRSRKIKYDLFMKLLKPSEKSLIIDVGVSNYPRGDHSSLSIENYFENAYPWGRNITAVGMHDFKHFKTMYSQMQMVTGDGKMLPFIDKAFEIAFSNAVIEHVGDLEEQRKFINELCRVAKKIYLTTPNKWFPIESHTLTVFIHWLPILFQRKIFHFMKKQIMLNTYLLGPRDLKYLSPQGYKIRIINNILTIILILDEKKVVD